MSRQPGNLALGATTPHAAMAHTASCAAGALKLGRRGEAGLLLGGAGRLPMPCHLRYTGSTACQPSRKHPQKVRNIRWSMLPECPYSNQRASRACTAVQYRPPCPTPPLQPR